MTYKALRQLARKEAYSIAADAAWGSVTPEETELFERAEAAILRCMRAVRARDLALIGGARTFDQVIEVRGEIRAALAELDAPTEEERP